MYELVVSLGERASLLEDRARLNGEDYGPRFRVVWRAAIYNPFSLPRKAERCKMPGRQALKFRHRMIVDAEPIDPVPMSCITVDSPFSMYLCGRGMIPTHNTRTGAEWVRSMVAELPKSRGAFVAKDPGEARDVMVEGVSGILACSSKFDMPEYKPSLKKLVWPNGAEVGIFSSEEYEELRGPQHHWCFVAGTMIRCESESVPIQSLGIGDRVLTRIGPKKIIRTGSRIAQVGTVTFNTGDTLTGTADHPVMTLGGWIPMAELRVGECAITTRDGFVAEVVSTWTEDGEAPVFNVTVDDAHEYYANGILVHNCWCDELPKWRNAEKTWEQVMFGLRLGARPRVCITSTPRPIKVLKEIIRDPLATVTRGTTYDNLKNLSPLYQSIVRKYEGTRLGRQELDAQILDDVPGALWTYGMIDQTRVFRVPEGVELIRAVVALDPSANEDGNAAGIVAAAKGSDGRGYVLADRTLQGRPEAWARKAVQTWREFMCDRIVGEANNGGQMIEATINAYDKTVPVKLVHASRGKITRAEPIALLYERGFISHVGSFPELEDEMCQYQETEIKASIQSPNRMDALVWALTELFEKGDANLDDAFFGAALRTATEFPS